MMGAAPWTLEKAYPIVNANDRQEDIAGKIALIKRDKIPFYEKVKQAEEAGAIAVVIRSEEHTSELQSRGHLVCRLLLEKKKTTDNHHADKTARDGQCTD